MIKIYIDAATDQNRGISAGGMLVIQDKQQFQMHQPLSSRTNNEAEFEMMVFSLKYLLDNQLEMQTIFLYTDSKIVYQSIKKKYVKEKKFKPFLEKILHQKDLFTLLFIEWIAESSNKGADQLAKQALQKAKNT